MNIKELIELIPQGVELRISHSVRKELPWITLSLVNLESLSLGTRKMATINISPEMFVDLDKEVMFLYLKKEIERALERIL